MCQWPVDHVDLGPDEGDELGTKDFRWAQSWGLLLRSVNSRVDHLEQSWGLKRFLVSERKVVSF